MAQLTCLENPFSILEVGEREREMLTSIMQQNTTTEQNFQHAERKRTHRNTNSVQLLAEMNLVKYTLVHFFLEKLKR